MVRKSAANSRNRSPKSKRLPILTPKVLAKAIRATQHMSQQEKLQCSDDLYLHQPHLLASILALHRNFGASLEEIDSLLELLITTWQAMKFSGHQWPLITEQQQDDCLTKITAKIQFSQGMPATLLEQAVEQHVSHHPEPYLMAFVIDELHKQNWQQISDDTAKYIMLVALNLVECVAAVA